VDAIKQAAEFISLEGLPTGDAIREPRCVASHQQQGS